MNQNHSTPFLACSVGETQIGFVFFAKRFEDKEFLEKCAKEHHIGLNKSANPDEDGDSLFIVSSHDGDRENSSHDVTEFIKDIKSSNKFVPGSSVFDDETETVLLLYLARGNFA